MVVFAMLSDHRLTEVLPLSGYLRRFNPARWFMLLTVFTHGVGVGIAVVGCDVRGNQMECENFLMGS